MPIDIQKDCQYYHDKNIGWIHPQMVEVVETEEGEMSLLREDGEKAGLYDICSWIIEMYPPDIFIGEPELIIVFRDIATLLLDKQKKKESEDE